MSIGKKRTVFISGKFKVFHSGHIRLFMYAKSLGNHLTVALDSDDLDIDEVNWRVDFLKNQQFVDSVVVFQGDVTIEIGRTKPDIVLKGNEFESRFNSELSAVKKYGGQLVFSSGSTFFSESDLLDKEYPDLSSTNLRIPRDFMDRNNIATTDLLDLVEKFAELEICVIGDLIVDEYINCHPLGMSREEPTLVVTPIDSKRFLGGAGIVSAHTVGLGAKTTFISVIGDDEIGNWGVKRAEEYGLKIVPFFDQNRPTTLKQRYRSEKHTLLKVSHLSQELISSDIQKQILHEFEKIAPSLDILILSDFSYGIFSEDFAQELIRIAKNFKILVAADSQTSSQAGSLQKFYGADLITPTEFEARTELRDNISGLAFIVEKLRKKLNSKNVLLKLGSDGVLIQSVNLLNEPIPTEALSSLNPNPLDISGAGDSMLAAASMSMRISADLNRAALIGSMCSAIQISRTGNLPISQENLIEILKL
jgi:rfaE bifunctional protein kinase chain/domain